MLVLLGLSTIAGSILVHFFFTFLKVNYPLELEILLYIRTFFNLAMSYYFAHQKLEFHYKKSVICTLIYISLNITMGLVGVMNFPDFMAEAKIIGSNVGTIVVGIGVVIFYLKSSHKNLVQTSYWKYALSFGLPMMIQLVGFKILSQSDKLMISFLCGDYFAGLYSVPFAIGSIMQTLWNCVGQGFQPWMFTKLSTNNIQDIKKITSILFLFVGLVTVSISATAPLIMQIMASNKYYDGVYVLMPIVVGFYFSFFNMLIITLATFYKKLKYIPIITILGTSFNMIFNYYGILWFGYIAAAYVTIVCNIIFIIMDYFFIYKKMYIDVFPFKKIILGGCNVFILSGLMVTLYDYPIYRYSALFLIIILSLFYEIKNKAFRLNFMRKNI